jgi:hypothetical protein
MQIPQMFYQPYWAIPLGRNLWRASDKKHWLRLVPLPGIMAGVMLTATITSAQLPINDDILHATVVTAVPFVVGPIDTSEATAAIDDPQDCHNNGSNWYTFTPTTDISIEVHTIGSAYDTTLGVYAGAPGALSLIECNDDFYGLQSAIRFDAAANTTYYIMVGFCCGNENTGGGTLFFTIVELPPPLDITLVLHTPGSVRRVTGTATIGGTVACNQPVEVEVSGQLRQKFRRRIFVGTFFTRVACDGETPWSAIVRSDQWAFRRGYAEILGGALGCDQYTCDDEPATAIVWLRGKRRGARHAAGE